jgi:outer membrane protein assembly factor BamD
VPRLQNRAPGARIPPAIYEDGMRTWIILIVALMALPTSAPAQETDAQAATYQAAARATYQEGLSELADADYLDAARLFNQVRSRFSYSQYAPLAELRLGDVYFGEEKFATAIEQYRGFIKLHPSHAEVPYAAWKVAQAFVGQVPDDWFFMPPAYEKDQARTRDAQRELKFFIAKYPESKYGAEAKKQLSKVRRQLADHELYVAEFYLKKSNHRAAAGRLTGLLKDFNGLGLDARALTLLAHCYIALGDMNKAKAALQDLVEFHPNDPLSEQARDYLASHRL